MGSRIAHKASKTVNFLSNQFSLPQMGGIYKRKGRNYSLKLFLIQFFLL